MFEDDVFDAFEFLNSCGKRNPVEVTKNKDETKEPGASSFTSRFVSRNKTYEIGIHKGKYTPETKNEDRSNSVENIPASKTTFNRGYYDNVSPSISGITITTPLVKEMERKGILISCTEASEIEERPEEESPEERICASSDNESIELLNDAVKDFNVENRNQYLFYGLSNAKRVREEFTRLPLDLHQVTKNGDIKTLGDSLAYFDLSSHLQQLETSLENVRRNIINKETHEDCFKKIDKEIQKLSFKYHPDKVKSRGGTEEDIMAAQKFQTALNATRTALKLLNSAFIEDIGTDHKFGFYTKLNINSLCNEDEMKSHIYEVIFKISVISRIKQQNIISEIRKFLIASKDCIHSYLGKLNDFEKCRDLALFHLKYCIKGFKKLCAELEGVKEQCKSEKKDENMYSLIQSMARESKRDLKLLKMLKKTAKASLSGKYQFFSPEEIMDPYFVLPLVSYTNFILMCNVMVRRTSVLDKINRNFEAYPRYRDDLGYLFHPYYLASYCSGNKYHEKTALKIMGKEQHIQKDLNVQITKAEVELEFYKCVEQIEDFMGYKFKVEDYYEAPATNLLALDLKKCMTLMTEFQEKQQEVSKSIKEFQKKTEKLDEKYEKFDRMMEATEELNEKVKARLEQSKKMSEKIANALADQL